MHCFLVQELVSISKTWSKQQVRQQIISQWSQTKAKAGTGWSGTGDWGMSPGQKNIFLFFTFMWSLYSHWSHVFCADELRVQVLQGPPHTARLVKSGSDPQHTPPPLLCTNRWCVCPSKQVQRADRRRAAAASLSCSYCEKMLITLIWGSGRLSSLPNVVFSFLRAVRCGSVVTQRGRRRRPVAEAPEGLLRVGSADGGRPTMCLWILRHFWRNAPSSEYHQMAVSLHSCTKH